MRTQPSQTERQQAAADAMQSGWEADADLDAWTLFELDDELGSLRPAFAGSHDAAS